MKKLFLIVPVFALVFSSCKPSQIVSYSDDVYSSPTEEKRLAKIAAAEKAKKEAEEKEKQEQARLAQKTKDDANPYYKDPVYSADDYYDYQYASRVRRFGSPLSGAGYYDNYYTNSYWYNQNPACYGSSIYGSYNYLMPSNQFNNYYNGLSFGMGYGYNNGYGYNPYCGNYGYGYNPYYGYGNSYNNGYYNGYNNGYYSGMYGYGYNPYYPNGYYGSGYYGSGYGSGWGYYNSQDVNSGYSHYGIRGSNGGGNSPRSTSGGMAVPQEYSGERAKLILGVQQQQESTPRFTEVPHRKVTIDDNNGSYTGPVKNGGYNQGENTGKPNNGNSPRGTSSQPYDYNSNTNKGGTKGSNSWNNYESNPNSNTNNGNTPRSNHGNSTKTYAPEKDDKTYGTSSEKSSFPGGGWNGSGNSGSSTSSPRGGSSQNSGSRPR